MWDVVEGVRENLVEKRSEWRSEPAVERRIGQGEFPTDASEVALTECFYRAVVDGESERECPEQRGSVELPSTFDKPRCAG